ncbi:MAG: phosphate ABC transporter substrate-binding protein [Microcoleaceae cyanobacterium]
MAQRSGPPPIVYILAFLLLLGLGYWFFPKKPKLDPVVNPNPSSPVNSQSNSSPLPAVPPPPPPGSQALQPPTSVPAGTVVKIDGSTSMVTINQNLKQGFQAQFPGTTVETAANGTNNGIQGILQGSIDIAGASRALSSQEQGQGLVAQPVATDQIAVVVGVDNPYTGGLTAKQISGIFTGQITNWSELGGADAPIRVINRPAVSGTHQAFQELVLQGQNFGNSPNFTTLERDETTGLLRQLGPDGIGYATFAQVTNQQTVRALPIDGVAPGSVSYPYQRELMYIYKTPPTPNVQAFLGYALSPQGQEAMFSAN